MAAMSLKPRLPSSATIIACIALFVALGGTGYAASQIAHSGAEHKKSHRKPSQRSLINAAVAKYFASHRSQFVGPRGPGGAIGSPGPTGAPGSPGPTGETGPAGLASGSAKLAGPVSTGSSSVVDLGGPSVTVKVGPSGLVAFWATARLKSVGGGTAEVTLEEPSGSSVQIQNSSSSAITYYTKPESNSGTIIFNAGLSTDFVGSGNKTFKLEYSDSGGTGTFENVELVVIPL